jgi:hypothetical protein
MNSLGPVFFRTVMPTAVQAVVVGQEMLNSSLPLGTFCDAQVTPESVVTVVPPSPDTKQVVADGQLMAFIPYVGFGAGTTVQVAPASVVAANWSVYSSVA